MMRNYQKLTLVTAILGSIIPVVGLFLYFLVNSFIGIPILALVLGGALIGAVITIAINIGAIVAAFKIKNTKIAGAALMGCGGALFLVLHFFAIPGLILYVIAGFLALREKNLSVKKV
jgi:hypothetical protein